MNDEHTIPSKTGAITGAVAGPYAELARSLRRFETRVSLLSPPRTGSTVVARLLWQRPELTHHCHEPFEASYWSDAGVESVANVLTRPMEIATGQRVPLATIERGGLLIKEMTFQMGPDELRFAAQTATCPVLFVVRDPRLSTTSRLRIVKELSNADTFAPIESGWPSLDEQVQWLRAEAIPYVIVDSERLRAAPGPALAGLATRLGLSPWADDPSWTPRPGLSLCTPEVGALMGEGRTADDPFYRRVLSSTGVEPPDAVDWDREEHRIAQAGLTRPVAEWMAIHERLLDDPNLVGPRD